jgi:peptidylprolyl isomerase
MKKTTALLCALAFAAPVAFAQKKPAPKAGTTKAKAEATAKAGVPSAAKVEAPAATKKESKMVKTESGLGYEDLVVGTGPSPASGQTCVMHYTGWL